MNRKTRILLALAAACGAVLPALGQTVYPPIPGPFLAMQPLPAAVPMAPSAPSRAPGYGENPVPAAPGQPVPGGGLRLPYWMQAAPRPAAPSVPGRTTVPTYPERAVPPAPPSVATGFGQRLAPGTFPDQTPTRAAPQTAYRPAPAPQAASPAYGAPQGWGYGAPPGWAPAPYTPQAGWGGWTPYRPAPGSN